MDLLSRILRLQARIKDYLTRRFAQRPSPRSRQWSLPVLPPRMRAGAAIVLAGMLGAVLAGRYLRSGDHAVRLAVTHADQWSQQPVSPTWPGYLRRPTQPNQAPKRFHASQTIPAVVHGQPMPVSQTQLVPAGQAPANVAKPDDRNLPQPIPPAAGQNASPSQPRRIDPWPVARYTQPQPSRPTAPAVRSEALEKIARQADQQIRHGFDLAGRGAYFAARAEFIAALRLVAQGLDSEHRTTVHSQALSDGLTALKEAHDFIPGGTKLEAELDLRTLIAGHRTPVLKNAPATELQPMRAVGQYFTYAQQRFAAAVGQEVAGSMALSALGKLHAGFVTRHSSEVTAAEPKAIVFFQAAILACPKNYMASNDLGVLLARTGDHAGARRNLEHSVAVCRSPENLHNLGVVYQQAGQQVLAVQAEQKAQLARQEENNRLKNAKVSAGGAVQWVDESALVQAAGPWSDPSPATRSPAAATTTNGAAEQSSRPTVGSLPWPLGPATTR